MIIKHTPPDKLVSLVPFIGGHRRMTIGLSTADVHQSTTFRRRRRRRCSSLCVSGAPEQQRHQNKLR